MASNAAPAAQSSDRVKEVALLGLTIVSSIALLRGLDGMVVALAAGVFGFALGKAL